MGSRQGKIWPGLAWKVETDLIFVVSQTAGDLYKEVGLETFIPSVRGTEEISVSASQDSLQGPGGAR